MQCQSRKNMLEKAIKAEEQFVLNNLMSFMNRRKS